MQKKKQLSIWTLAAGIIATVVIVLCLLFIPPYNRMISLQETIGTKQANIQTQLQARFDKINEMMPTVEAALNQNSDIAKEINRLSSNIPGTTVDAAGKVQIDPNASREDLEAADQAAGTMVRDLSQVIQNDPELRNDTSVEDFMVAVEGMENRIAVARKNYNEAVQEYNTYIRGFPHNIAAGMFGFEKAESFSASSQAQS